MVSATKRFCLALCLFCVSLGAAAQPAHERFDRALHRHVKAGVVDYPAIAADDEFRAYVASLADPVSLSSRDDRLVYYMNAYNALAIQGILEGLSPATLLGRIRYFKLKDWKLNGGEIDLYDLEHDLLIPLEEPRIHFSIVCASKSCPEQRSEAYTAEKVQSQMEANARAFINDPERNRFERERKVAHLSEIFKWYEDEFSKSAGSVQKYLARYVNDPATARDLSAERYTIEWIAYDWSLNGVSPSADSTPRPRASQPEKSSMTTLYRGNSLRRIDMEITQNQRRRYGYRSEGSAAVVSTLVSSNATYRRNYDSSGRKTSRT